MVTSPQLSDAVASSIGIHLHSYVVGRDEGELRRCGSTVMVWVAEELLPASSVAVKVRTIT